MGQAYKNCQSCGMPLARDEKVGGTEANGAKSVAAIAMRAESLLVLP